MIKIYSLLFVLTIFSIHVNCQNSIYKSYNNEDSWKDYANCAKPTSDGGIIIAGSMTDVNGLNRFGLLLKLDSASNILWSKTFDPGNICEFFSIEITSENDFLLIGTVGTDFLNPYGTLVVKTDSMGNVKWSKTFEGYEALSSCSISDKGFLICGQTLRTTGTGGKSVVNVTKIDSSGNLVWINSYGGLPDTTGEVGFAIAEAGDHGIIVTGVTYSFGSVNGAIFLIKTDSVGTFEWAKTYDGIIPGNLSYDGGYSILSTPDSGFIFTGTGSNDPWGENAILVKTDKNGNILWAKSISEISPGGNSGNSAYGQKIISVDSGFVVLMNDFTTTVHTIIKTDTSGNLIWGKSFHNSPGEFDFSYSVWQSGVSDFTIVMNSNTNNNDICLIKTNDLPDSCSNSSITISNAVYNPVVADVIFVQEELFEEDTVFTFVTDVIFSDSIICPNALPTSINESVMNDNFLFNIYPNPASTKLMIETDSNGRITVYDLLGRAMEIKTVWGYSKGKVELDLSKYPSGIYFVRVGNSVRKFIKK